MWTTQTNDQKNNKRNIFERERERGEQRNERKKEKKKKEGMVFAFVFFLGGRYKMVHHQPFLAWKGWSAAACALRHTAHSLHLS